MRLVICLLIASLTGCGSLSREQVRIIDLGGEMIVYSPTPVEVTYEKEGVKTTADNKGGSNMFEDVVKLIGATAVTGGLR